jgi:cation diffusion facilitator family transporter
VTTDSNGFATCLPRHDERAHRAVANRALGFSALGLGLAGVLELAVAILTGSVALLGDALHNLSDVSTSLVVFVGFRVSRRSPTERYPYGFERAEDLAGLGVALVIWASALFAGYESFHKLVSGGETTHLGLGIAAAAVGVIANQLVARYKGRVGRRIQSSALIADAKHSWLDSLASVGALLGLVAVGLGQRWGDPVAGFAVTLFIIHVGYEVTSQLAHHIMDGVDVEDCQAARVAAQSVPGVESAAVRGRWTGRSLILEVEGRVRSDLTVAEAERVGSQVEEAVFDAVEAVRQVRWTARPVTAG